MNPKRILAAGTTAMLAATIGVSAPGLAHDGSDGKTREVRRVIIVKDKDGKEVVDRRIEDFRGEGEAAVASCKGERSEIDESSDQQRTRIVLCGDKLSPADRAKRLEETLDRIRKDEHLSAEHRAKVETALEQAIARLRETK